MKVDSITLVKKLDTKGHQRVIPFLRNAWKRQSGWLAPRCWGKWGWAMTAQYRGYFHPGS